MNIPSLIQNQEETLRCRSPGYCTGTPPSIQWKGRAVENVQVEQHTLTMSTEVSTHESEFTRKFDSTHHKTTLTCIIVYMNDIITEQHVTLIVNCKYLLFTVIL